MDKEALLAIALCVSLAANVTLLFVARLEADHKRRWRSRAANLEAKILIAAEKNK